MAQIKNETKIALPFIIKMSTSALVIIGLMALGAALVLLSMGQGTLLERWNNDVWSVLVPLLPLALFGYGCLFQLRCDEGGITLLRCWFPLRRVRWVEIEKVTHALGKSESIILKYKGAFLGLTISVWATWIAREEIAQLIKLIRQRSPQARFNIDPGYDR